MKFKKYLLFIVCFIFLSFSLLLKIEEGIKIKIEEFSDAIIFFFPNIIISIYIIFETERYQHIFNFLKMRITKNKQLYFSLIKSLCFNSFIKVFLLVMLPIVFLIVSNKKEIIAYYVLYSLGIYIAVIFIRSILSFFLQTKIITLIILLIFSLNFIFSNFPAFNMIADISGYINPFTYNVYDATLYRLIAYVVLTIITYLLMGRLNIIKRIKIDYYLLILIISLLLILFNARIERLEYNHLILFYSSLDNNFFEFILYNFLFYYTMIFKSSLMVYNFKNGIYLFFQYRIFNKKILKRLIIKDYYQKEISNIILLVIIAIILLLFKKYNVSVDIVIFDIIKLIMIVIIANNLLLIVNNKFNERILIIALLFTFLSLILTTFNIIIILLLFIVTVFVLFLKKELN